MNKDNKIAVGIFFTAFLVRVAMVFFAASRGLLQVWEYETITDNILNGMGYAIKHLGVVHYSFGPPLYPIFSAIVYYVTNHSHLALGLAQAFLSAATCVIIFEIGKKVFGWRAGLVAAAMTALHPGLIVYVGKLHSFNIDTLLLVLVVFALLKAGETMSVRWFIFLGVASGLCLLSRSTVFLFLPFAFGFLWIRSTGKKRLLNYIILSCVVVIIIVGPWVLRNYIVLNKFVFIQESGEVFWRGNNQNATGTAFTDNGKPILETMSEDMHVRLQSLNGIDQDRLFWSEGFRFIMFHPFRFIVLTVKKFYYFWWFSPHSGIEYPRYYLMIYKAIYMAVLLLAIVGIIAALISKIIVIKEYAILLIIFFIIISASQSLFYIEGRHRWAIEPLMLIFTANGIVNIKRAFK